MKTKAANCAFLVLLLVILLVACQTRPAHCSPDTLYLDSIDVQDGTPSPTPRYEMNCFAPDDPPASFALDETTAPDVYWYSRLYTGTLASGSYTLYIYYSTVRAGFDVTIEVGKCANDGSGYVDITTDYLWTGVNTAGAITLATLDLGTGAETSFNDERLRLHFYCTDKEGPLYFDGVDEPSRLITPSGTPPIPEFPSTESQIAILVINLLIVSHLLRRGKKSTRK